MSTIVTQIRAFLRALTFTIAVSCYFLTALPFYPYFKVNPMGARRLICHILGAYARFALWFMGFEVTQEIKEAKGKDNYLFVSNHLSYTDVLVVCGYYPSCFVTSVEMRDTPFLGQICKLGGCVFVERRNKSNLGQEVAEITEALKAGLDVVIFPEATSTNGEEVIRFRRPLFKSAIDSKISVKPLTINYRYLDDEPVTCKNRDKVFWYGDMTFADHLWGVFSIRKIKVDLTVGESLKVGEEQDHGVLAELSHSRVRSSYRPVLC
jgi:1-acyl-sn-glycerol-3-phosphate acyltransferase